jgi:subtilisin family serine protease
VSTTPNTDPYVPDNPIARWVLKDPRVVSNADEVDDALVIAVKQQLLAPDVKTPTNSQKGVIAALKKVAHLVATVDAAGGGLDPRAADVEQADGAPSGRVQVWKLDHEDINPLTEARKIRESSDPVTVRRLDGSTSEVPSVSPNHVAIVSPNRGSGCPAGPPRDAKRPRGSFIEPFDGRDRPRVVVLDTGYIHVDPPHERLDERITVAAGEWLDLSVDPPKWRENPPDQITLDPDGRLIGIVGHGTFIAGLVAHVCPQAAITVVGHRDNEVPVGDGANQYRLWASELALGRSLVKYRDADVIQCGFAFPTLDDQPSLPFAAAMDHVRAHNPGIAVVSPAGNEESIRRYWPAALPDVIGVAATKHDGRYRAKFSNWGPWADCCAIGAGVRSTYIRWEGRVEDEHPDEIEDFEGWARWEGTSFAAPKVSGAIARELALHPEWTPAEAYDKLIAGNTDIQIRDVSSDLYPPDGYTLPEVCVY